MAIGWAGSLVVSANGCMLISLEEYVFIKT